MGPRPSTGGLRSFSSHGDAGHGSSSHGDASRPTGRPPARTPGDHRYARPTSYGVHNVYYAHHPVPVYRPYRPYYTRWYVHPWYRYQYATWAVVSFGFVVSPWDVYWIPPARGGWSWSPGYWSFGVWHPGCWVPVGPAPVGYVYVDGWWDGQVYVDGYYRVSHRNGWTWSEGSYQDDDTYSRGHWEPDKAGPDGYTWEAGFWDGNEYVDGFWRPEFLSGYAWVGAYYDDDGVYHSGYWMPTEDKPGQVWVPGWFDGNEWVSGYWVPDDQYTDDAVKNWEPPEGVEDGWDQEVDPRGAAPSAKLHATTPPADDDSDGGGEDGDGSAPLALPVNP